MSWTRLDAGDRVLATEITRRMLTGSAELPKLNRGRFVIKSAN
ncbi:MAG TPA: hypothetical protein VIP98_24250 [Microlunatus sp.]